jgi:hypothetical protein
MPNRCAISVQDYGALCAARAFRAWQRPIRVIDFAPERRDDLEFWKLEHTSRERHERAYKAQITRALQLSILKAPCTHPLRLASG